MKPRKVPTSNTVYTLPGGNEDNDLHARSGRLGDGHVNLEDRDPAAGTNAPYIAVVYEPTNDERAGISTGLMNVELILLGLDKPPPIILRVTDEQPKGKPLTHGAGDGQSYIWAAMPVSLVGQLLDLTNPDASDGVRAGLALEPEVAQFREVIETGYRTSREQEAEGNG